jgi:hypothetical protein
MEIPVLSLNDGRQSSDMIQTLFSDEFRDIIRFLCGFTIALLIFHDLKEAMQSVSVSQIRVNVIDGMMILRLL